MARGGARPGAGRPSLTDAEKAQRNEARNAKRRAARKTTKPKARKKAAPAAYCQGGVKTGDAPTQWPFGTQPPQPEAPPAAADAEAEPVITGATPLEFLLNVVKEPRLKLAVRMQAAALAAPYEHAKPAPVGKKDARNDAAKATEKKSKFAAAAAPRLVSSR